MASLLDSILAKAIDSGLRYVTKKTGLYDPLEENAMRVKLSQGKITRQEYNDYKRNKEAEKMASQPEVGTTRNNQSQSNINGGAKWPPKAKAVLSRIESGTYKHDYEYISALIHASNVLLDRDYYDEFHEVWSKVKALISGIDLTKRDNEYVTSMYNYAKNLYMQKNVKSSSEMWLFEKLAENNLSACDNEYVNTLLEYSESLLMRNLFGSARAMFDRLSNGGVSRAMFYLLTFYRSNIVTGSLSDSYKADSDYAIFHVYRKGHEANDFLCTYAYACILLGSNNFNKEMLGKSIFDSAFNSLLQKANEGDKLMQCIVGEGYYNGTGVKKDYAQAVHWYEKAAYQDFAWAQYMLGECYYCGNGVKANREQCLKWFRVADGRGLTEARNVVKDFDRFWKNRPKPWGEVFQYDLGDW